MVKVYNDSNMPLAYDHDFYSRNFARLLNRAMNKGAGDATKALEWLDRKYKPFWNILLSKHKAEMSDAYMDVREHIVKRIKDGGGDADARAVSLEQGRAGKEK